MLQPRFCAGFSWVRCCHWTPTSDRYNIIESEAILHLRSVCPSIHQIHVQIYWYVDIKLKIFKIFVFLEFACGSDKI